MLARVFGASGDLFDREQEQQIFGAVAHAGLGPKLLVSAIVFNLINVIKILMKRLHMRLGPMLLVDIVTFKPLSK